MEIKIAELMDFYAPESAAEGVSAERVRRRTLARLGTARRKRRLRTVLLAAALAALLAVGAAAAKSIGFDELPALLRHCFGIEGTAETGLRYDSVSEAPGARTADPKASGSGELYISRGPVLRSENLYVLDLYVSTVTDEQAADLVWRVRERGGETWAAASVIESDGDSAQLRAALPAALFEDGREPELELCCGTESADGRSFAISRVGIFRPLPVAYQETAVLTCALPLTEQAVLVGAEISSTHVILCFDAPELAAGFDALVSNHSPALADAVNALTDAVFRMELRFDDGTALRFFPDGGTFSDGEFFYLAMTLGPAVQGRAPAALMADGTELPFAAAP